LQGVAGCCRVLQGVAGCCRVLQCVAVRLELLRDALESATQSVLDVRMSLKARCMFVYIYVCLELTHCPKERGAVCGWSLWVDAWASLGARFIDPCMCVHVCVPRIDTLPQRARHSGRVSSTHVQYVAVYRRALSVLQCVTLCRSRRVAFIENRRNMLY